MYSDFISAVRWGESVERTRQDLERRLEIAFKLKKRWIEQDAEDAKLLEALLRTAPEGSPAHRLVLDFLDALEKTAADPRGSDTEEQHERLNGKEIENHDEDRKGETDPRTA